MTSVRRKGGAALDEADAAAVIAIPFAFVPSLSRSDVEALRAAFAARTMAPSTRRALRGDGKLFVTWCSQAKRQAMPASRETVVAFLAAAAADGRSAATLRRYRSSLAWWHAAGGFANPCGGSAVAVPVPEPDVTDTAMAALRDFMDLAQRGYAPATLRATEADVRRFAGWCVQQGLPWLPAEPATVGRYIREIGPSRKPATVARYLASIALIHRAAGHSEPCRHWRVTLERRGHARDGGSEQRQAAALTDAVLAPILDRLDPDQPDRRKPLKPIDLRDRALLLVGRDTLARADELVALRWADLRPVDPALIPRPLSFDLHCP
ncbi:site-specific integrase [Azospirillum agricola]|uniref:site-specific integrase n=1 Tax=Azospirillum agricola TaxID=1720247 RepID=UPI0015C4AB8D|nr:site-specific integrase [Azospirillum agricola]